MMKKHFRLHIPVAYYSPVTTFPPAWPRQQVSSSSSEANDWFYFWFGTSSSSMLHSVEPCLLAGWSVRFYSLLVHWLVIVFVFLLVCWLLWIITVVSSLGFWFVGWQISWSVCLLVGWLVSFFWLFFWLAG